VSFNTGTRTRKTDTVTTAPDTEVPTTSVEPTDAAKPEINIKPSTPPRGDDAPPKPVISTTPARKPEPPAEKPKTEGAKRKGKKGDGEN